MGGRRGDDERKGFDLRRGAWRMGGSGELSSWGRRCFVLVTALDTLDIRKTLPCIIDLAGLSKSGPSSLSTITGSPRPSHMYHHQPHHPPWSTPPRFLDVTIVVVHPAITFQASFPVVVFM